MRSTRHQPVQQRSRARVQQILQSASELLAEGGVPALTTRSLAERTGIPVGTIYRYFEDRDAIIAAYLDHQLEEIERSISQALLALEAVTMRSLIETVALAHLRHHQAHPEGVQVWFGGRLNAAVDDSVRELDDRLAASLRAAINESDMLERAPSFGAGILVRLFDRVYEFVFSAPRTAEQQEAVVLAFVDMVATYMERFAAPAGIEGVPAERFLAALRAGEATRENA